MDFGTVVSVGGTHLTKSVVPAAGRKRSGVVRVVAMALVPVVPINRSLRGNTTTVVRTGPPTMLAPSPIPTQGYPSTIHTAMPAGSSQAEQAYRRPL